MKLLLLAGGRAASAPETAAAADYLKRAAAAGKRIGLKEATLVEIDERKGNWLEALPKGGVLIALDEAEMLAIAERERLGCRDYADLAREAQGAVLRQQPGAAHLESPGQLRGLAALTAVAPAGGLHFPGQKLPDDLAHVVRSDQHRADADQVGRTGDVVDDVDDQVAIVRERVHQFLAQEILHLHPQAVAEQGALGEVLGAGRLSFGSPDRLRRQLGVEPGSVTPLALINDGSRLVRLIMRAKPTCCNGWA